MNDWQFQMKVWGYAVSGHNDIALLSESRYQGHDTGWWDANWGWLGSVRQWVIGKGWMPAPYYWALTWAFPQVRPLISDSAN